MSLLIDSFKTLIYVEELENVYRRLVIEVFLDIDLSSSRVLHTFVTILFS